MSLRVKYLIPLNTVIVLMLLVHGYVDHAAFRRDFMAGQVSALEHLAVGLRAHVEHIVREKENVEEESAFLSDMASRPGELEIMLLRPDYVVVAATEPGLVGKRWYEKDFEEVAAGRADITSKTSDHQHEGVAMIDVSTAARAPSGQVAYLIHIARRQDELAAALSTQWRQHMLAALALLLAVALVVNWLTYRLIITPLDRVHERIRKTGWVAEAGRGLPRDELARLAVVVDRMIAEIERKTTALEEGVRTRETLLSEVSALKDGLAEEVERTRAELTEAQASLIRAERFAALGELSAALAHELRNPLHIVRASAETAARRHPETQELAQDIAEEVDRLEALIEELLDYTRPVDLRIEPVACGPLLGEVADRLGRATEGGTDERPPCLLEVQPSSAIAHADYILLGQALLNLVENACEASPEGQPVELSAEATEAGEVRFVVRDAGPGIAAEDRQRLFEPFFTRKPRGTGLGLAVVHKVAELHGGRVDLVARASGGTEAVLSLPPPQTEVRP